MRPTIPLFNHTPVSPAAAANEVPVTPVLTWTDSNQTNQFVWYLVELSTAANLSADLVVGISSQGTVSLTATPTTGWQFSGWYGSCSGSSPAIDVVMIDNLTCLALFTQISPGAL